MATIRFYSPDIDRTISIDVREGEKRTLLSIAKQHGIPVPFRCEAGECTACVVHVDTRSVGSRAVAQLTDKERSLLQSVYLLNPNDIEEAELRGRSPDVRLACQYEIGDEDIAVFFEESDNR
jgi:ferredoxin